MNTSKVEGVGVHHYTIRNITPQEMDKMIEIREMLRANLINHVTENKKKEYLNDDQLKDIFKILVVLTKDCNHREKTSFDEVDLNVEINQAAYAKEMEEAGLVPIAY